MLFSHYVLTPMLMESKGSFLVNKPITDVVGELDLKLTCWAQYLFSAIATSGKIEQFIAICLNCQVNTVNCQVNCSVDQH